MSNAIPSRLQQYKFQEAKFYSSRRGHEVDLVVLHYTAGRGNEQGLANFFSGGSRRASAHFGVGRTGGIIQMVDMDKNAWHPGKSRFLDQSTNTGWRSIGIEMCNTGWGSMDYHEEKHPDSIWHGRHRNRAARSTRWEKYTWPQVESVNTLLAELKEAIPTLKYVTGHEDIRNKHVVDIRGSKTDPGPAFPYHVLQVDALGMERWHFSFRDKEWYRCEDGVTPTH